jgi:hypothetical protein
MSRAAADGLLIVVYCSLCKRTLNYLASDLAEVLGPSKDARDPPFSQCSKCGSARWMTSRITLPSPQDYGKLEVRRPAGRETVQLWASVPLGEAPLIRTNSAQQFPLYLRKGEDPP